MSPRWWSHPLFVGEQLVLEGLFSALEPDNDEASGQVDRIYTTVFRKEKVFGDAYTEN